MRRGGGEQRGAGAQRRTGTRLKVEGDVVMEHADENPKRRAQDQRRGRGEMGRRSTGAQASAEEATGQWDARRIVGTASSVGQNGQQTGSSIGMWYSDGAEREVVTGENGRRRRGAALCPAGAARRQGSDLQERRTGRRIQYARVLANGVIGGIAGMGRWQCRCTRIRCSGATSRWRPSGLAAGVCGLSADLVHGGKALCVAGRCCIENIELTCAMLREVDHARPWWPGSTMQMQRREFGKRLRRMGGTGPQSRPQIHPRPPLPPHRAPGSQDGVRGGDRGSTQGKG